VLLQKFWANDCPFSEVYTAGESVNWRELLRSAYYRWRVWRRQTKIVSQLVCAFLLCYLTKAKITFFSGFHECVQTANPSADHLCTQTVQVGFVATQLKTGHKQLVIFPKHCRKGILGHVANEDAELS